MNINAETLVSALQRVMNSFESQQNSKVSAQELADISNSGYTTIRQIKNGSLRSLTIKKALEISTRLNGPKTLDELININDSERTSLEDYSRKFSHLFEYNMFPEKLEDLFSNKDFSSIIWAAFGAENITLEEIRFRWGQEGIERTDYLIDVGLLTKDGETIKGVSENGGFGIPAAYKQAQIGMSLYNLERSRKEENWMSFQTESVNQKFITEFREELRRVFKHFQERSSMQENFGSKRVFFNMIFDRYMEDIDSKREQLQ